MEKDAASFPVWVCVATAVVTALLAIVALSPSALALLFVVGMAMRKGRRRRRFW